MNYTISCFFIISRQSAFFNMGGNTSRLLNPFGAAFHVYDRSDVSSSMKQINGVDWFTLVFWLWITSPTMDDAGNGRNWFTVDHLWRFQRGRLHPLHQIKVPKKTSGSYSNLDLPRTDWTPVTNSWPERTWYMTKRYLFLRDISR